MDILISLLISISISFIYASLLFIFFLYSSDAYVPNPNIIWLIIIASCLFYLRFVKKISTFAEVVRRKREVFLILSLFWIGPMLLPFLDLAVLVIWATLTDYHS
jgi:hypothetical protein